MKISGSRTSHSENLVPKLLNLFYLPKNTKVFTKNSGNSFHWLPYFYYKNPVNLLFSKDQFFNEFLLKYPQRKKMSEYKLQLKEQKKLSLFYGSLSKKQLKKYFIETNGSQEKFLSLIERRLDVILYRSQFVKNISIARQLIIHKKVLVNQKIISIPSHLVNPGDIISIPSFTDLKLPTSLKMFLKPAHETDNVTLKDWNFKSKFLSKKQIEVFIILLMKKLFTRGEVQKYSNFFVKQNKKDFHFYIYKLENSFKIKELELDFFKKILFKTLSNLNFTILSKELFFLNLKKNLRKKISKNLMFLHLNHLNMKPIHLEFSHRIFTTIFLYSPQRVYYPFILDFDLLKRVQL